jgi:hypothetical protein
LTPTLEPTFTATPTADPTAGPTATLTPTLEPTFTATPAATFTPTATVQSAPLFSDGFETGTLANWSTVQSIAVQNQEIANGSFAARATGSAATTLGTYARKSLGTLQTDLYYRVRFKIISLAANTVNLLKLRSSVDTSIWSVSINNLGQLSYRNDVRGTSINSAQSVVQGAWQSLEVHLKVAGVSSQTEVWLNGALVSALSRTDDFGSNPIGRVQLGENTGGLTYDIAFDDVIVSTSFVTP